MAGSGETNGANLPVVIDHREIEAFRGLTIPALGEACHQLRMVKVGELGPVAARLNNLAMSIVKGDEDLPPALVSCERGTDPVSRALVLTVDAKSTHSLDKTSWSHILTRIAAVRDGALVAVSDPDVIKALEAELARTLGAFMASRLLIVLKLNTFLAELMPDGAEVKDESGEVRTLLAGESSNQPSLDRRYKRELFEPGILEKSGRSLAELSRLAKALPEAYLVVREFIELYVTEQLAKILNRAYLSIGYDGHWDFAVKSDVLYKDFIPMSIQVGNKGAVHEDRFPDFLGKLNEFLAANGYVCEVSNVSYVKFHDGRGYVSVSHHSAQSFDMRGRPILINGFDLSLKLIS